MQVVILCGGLGTRLREETEFRPKPMVPIGAHPILWHIMKIYAYYGHKEFILCLGYKGSVIKDYFRNYHWNTSDVTIQLGSDPSIKYHGSHDEEDWKVTLLDTGKETMTGGRLQRALPYIDADDFLLTYGDGVTNCDINASIAQHRAGEAVVTLTSVLASGRFGDLAIDGNRVAGFQEKPVDDHEINGGYFVVNRRIGDYLTGDDCILEQEPLQQLADEDMLDAYHHRGFWQCMDTYREYQELNRLWDTGEAPWKIW